MKSQICFKECITGYFGDGTTCTLCPSNQYKPMRGNADRCPYNCGPNSQANNQRTGCRKFF